LILSNRVFGLWLLVFGFWSLVVGLWFWDWGIGLWSWVMALGIGSWYLVLLSNISNLDLANRDYSSHAKDRIYFSNFCKAWDANYNFISTVEI